MSNGSLRIGIDAGGSFTRAAALRTEDGALYTAQIESNHPGPSQTFRDAILEVLKLAAAEPADILSIVHSTSAVTRALLGKRTHNIVLIVNKGFRHILETGRQDIESPRKAAERANIKLTKFDLSTALIRRSRSSVPSEIVRPFPEGPIPLVSRSPSPKN